MSDALTPKQMEALWALLATGGQGKTPAKAADPDDLIAKKIIRAGYSGTSKTARVEVSDKGWEWANAHFADETATPKALLPWFKQIKAYLDSKDLCLADLFVAPLEPLSAEPFKAVKIKAPAKPKAAPAPKPAKREAAVKGPKAPTPAQLRKRIEAAYLMVTGGKKGMRALLNDVRDQLPDLDRATLDAALTRLHERDKTMTLMRLDNPREITADVKAAQLMFKGEPLHLLWIDQ